MRERDFQTEFGKYLKAVKRPSAAYELKVVKGKSFAFSAIPQHQLDGLWHAKHGQIYMKLPDVGYQMPFDCFVLHGVDAYVVIRYEESGTWYAIDIDDFLAEVQASEKKSMREVTAKVLASFSG